MQHTSAEGETTQRQCTAQTSQQLVLLSQAYAVGRHNPNAMHKLET